MKKLTRKELKNTTGNGGPQKPNDSIYPCQNDCYGSLEGAICPGGGVCRSYLDCMVCYYYY
ncbi:hypothetical protein [Elizabethkingia anophelis]|nr:hypothetical protein [Elizabethkingia anophelis]AKH94468.1 hypothetical protein M876_07805 [Elizabethkingia anophelis FMS-007]